MDNPGRDSDQDPDTVSAPVPQPLMGDGPSIRYRECLKNHAASMGGHVVDGCGEFMPNGEDGTGEALKCAACECHRNFHRKEPTPLRQQRFPLGLPNGTAPCLPIAPAATMNFGGGQAGSSKKRFRTKFSKDQKEKMEFAEKLGWRIQKQNEAKVQQFCGEVGVKRQVFKFGCITVNKL